MKQPNAPIKSFAALAAVLHQADVDAAQRLRKSAPLRKGRKPGSGPAVAKPKVSA